MSRQTVARRWQKLIDALPKLSDDEINKARELAQLVGSHLIAGTQPQRRSFLGKTSGFKDKEDRRTNQKMLRAYLKGNVLFRNGFKDFKDKDGQVIGRVPNYRVVKQLNYFN